jgi:hypothetical protein
LSSWPLAIILAASCALSACSNVTRDYGAGAAGGGNTGTGAGGAGGSGTTGGAGGTGGAGTGGMSGGPPCDTGMEPQILSSGHDYVSQIVADGLTVFWTDRIGEIGTLVDGVPTVIASGYDWALGIAVDATHVAWTTSDVGGSVLLARKDGSDVVTLAMGQNKPWRVVLDATHAYWVNAGTNFGSDGEVMRVARDGTGLTALAKDQIYPLDLALAGAHVYFVSHGAGGDTDGALLRVPKSGGGVELVAGGLNRPTHLVSDGTHLYWTSLDGVWKLSMPQGIPAELVPGAASWGDLVVDGADLFFTEPNSGRVRGTTADGGPVATLAADQVEPHGIAVDGTTLYWTTLGDEQAGVTGTVMKICR